MQHANGFISCQYLIIHTSHCIVHCAMLYEFEFHKKLTCKAHYPFSCIPLARYGYVTAVKRIYRYH